MLRLVANSANNSNWRQLVAISGNEWQLVAINGLEEITKNDRVEKPDCGTLRKLQFQYFQRNRASTPIPHS